MTKPEKIKNSEIIIFKAEDELNESQAMRKVGISEFSTKPTNFYISHEQVSKVASDSANICNLRTYMKSYRINLSFLLALLLWTCQGGKRHIPDFSNEIDYAYKAIVFSQSKNRREIHAYKYYDKHDSLVEIVTFESRVKFVYDSIGSLQEKFWCVVYKFVYKYESNKQ